MLPQAIIIGAGPAGLTAAYELLKQTDIHPIVLEQEDFVGGLPARWSTTAATSTSAAIAFLEGLAGHGALEGAAARAGSTFTGRPTAASRRRAGTGRA